MITREPLIARLEQKCLVGVTSIVSLHDTGASEPLLWGMFYHLDQSLQIQRKPEFPCVYELEIWSEKEFKSPPDPAKEKFMYMVGVEVDDLYDIPHGCIGKTLPSGDHAIFTYTGKPIYILKAYMYIFKQWLPQSGYTMPFNYNYAYYKQSESPHDENSIIEICLPIVPTVPEQLVHAGQGPAIIGKKNREA